MRQQRVTKRKRVTDKRRPAREDEPQEEKPEIRPDLRHWFTEANT
jgi:hypothetical protein